MQVALAGNIVPIDQHRLFRYHHPDRDARNVRKR
jgi:hypothetical protein